MLKQHIFGGHVAEYMKTLKESDGEKYKVQFSGYMKDGIAPDQVRVQMIDCICLIVFIISWQKFIKMLMQKYAQIPLTPRK